MCFQRIRLAPVLTVPRPKVVLAEEDDAFRTLLSHILLRDGFDVRETRESAGLVQMIRARAAGRGDAMDIVVTDLRAGRSHGLDVLERVMPSLAGVPVVVMTELSDAAIRQRAQGLGVTCVLNKPFDLDDFRTVMMNCRAWLSRQIERAQRA